MSKGGWMFIGIGIAVAVYAGSVLRTTEPDITNFEECVAAGYPVMESYPEQCATPDGKRFINDARAPIRPGEDEPVYCTADAFQCPDGTYVGRTGPECEFICP